MEHSTPILKALRTIREEKCLSQTYVAEHSLITQSVYNRIENGKSNVSLERLGMILHALGSDYNELFNVSASDGIGLISFSESIKRSYTLIIDQLEIVEKQLEDCKAENILLTRQNAELTANLINIKPSWGDGDLTEEQRKALLELKRKSFGKEITDAEITEEEYPNK